MPIDPLPSISRSDANFRTQVDDYFLTRLPAFSTQAESARVQIVAAESTATSAASAAATAATTATTAADTATSASASAVTAKNAAEAAAANAINTPVAAPIHYATDKTAPADADELGITDSAASWGLKKLTFTNLKAWISSLGGAGISNTPSGNIQATNVQAAINELDSEKVSKTGDTISGNLNVTGNVLVTGGALGYGIGSGGAVTQATSKSTTVTLNKPTGHITMNNAALAAGASVSFQLSNNLITTADTFILTIDSYSITGIPPEKYSVSGSALASGAHITVKNISAGSLSETLSINFTIIKGAPA